MVFLVTRDHKFECSCNFSCWDLNMKDTTINISVLVIAILLVHLIYVGYIWPVSDLAIQTHDRIRTGGSENICSDFKRS